MKKTFIISVLLLIGAINSHAAEDSTIVPSSGIAGIVPTSDTTADTLTLSRFVAIEDVPIMDGGTANLLTVSMEEGDFSTYVVARYNLLDYSGKVLYTNRYRICGNSYTFLMDNGIGYVFWKICNTKGFVKQH